MYGRKCIKFFITVLYVVGIAHTDPGKEDFRELTQDGSEIILSTQTALRKTFINMLTDIKNRIPAQTTYFSTVNDVIKGLLTRNLDPLKVVNILNGNQSSVEKLVRIVNSFRECSQAEPSFSNWYSFLQTIPKIDTFVPPSPIVNLADPHWQKAVRMRSPYASVVLSAIEKNHLRLTLSLFQNILFNFPFLNTSPDVISIVNNMIQFAELEKISFEGYKSAPHLDQTPNEILRKILRHIARKLNVGSRLSNQSTQLLSVLDHLESMRSSTNEYSIWNSLETMNGDDYPPDIINAKNELVLALKKNPLGLNESRLQQDLKGFSPTEKALALISRLTFIPNENPLSGKIHAIYPHVKLRYLSNNERYFQPRTSGDIAFLLNSFLTIDNKMNPSLIKEIHNIFLLPNFSWTSVLKDFDYSQYSKPRTMMLDILQELLNNADKLPPCEIIMFSYFIKNNTDVPGCSIRSSVPDLLAMKLSAPTTPISITPSFTQTSTVSGDTTTTTTMTTTNLPPMKHCPYGEPRKFVEPESIVEIIDSSYHTNFIKDLIRYNPMSAEIYSDNTRLAIYRKVLEYLRDNKYNDEVTEFVIDQAIMRLPLNEKRHLPPNYVYLCPSEVSEMESKAPVHSPPSDAAVSALLHKTTTTISSLVAVGQPVTMSPLNPITVEGVGVSVTMPPNPVAVEVVTHPVAMPPNPVAVEVVSQPITMPSSPATSEIFTVPPASLLPCEKPVSVIDQYSIIEIANEDTNYERIKYLINSTPMLYENYKHLTTREQVLKAALEEKKRNTNNPVEKYDITQIILRLRTTPDGQLEPLVLQECSLNSIYEPPVWKNCPPDRRLTVISPQELLDIIEPKFPSRFIEGLVTSRPILWENYKHHPTRRDVLRTLLQERTLEMTKEYVTHNLGVSIEYIPVNSNANLPPTAVTICQEDETTTVSTVEFPETTVPGRRCNDNEELKTVIDPYSLLEIIDGENRKRVEVLVFIEPILADKYLILGTRANVLSHFLRQHYAGCNGHITDPELMRISSGLLINDKGMLPPLVRDECLIVSKSKDDKRIPTENSKIVPMVTQPKSYPPTTVSVSVDDTTLDHMTPYPVPLSVPEIGSPPASTVKPVVEERPPATTPAGAPVDTPSCYPNEIATLVYDTNTVFNALASSAPAMPYIREAVTTYLIPVEHGNTYSKVEILEIILNAILEAAKDEKIINNVNVLKTYLLYEGPGKEVPGVVNVCLPNSDVNGETFVDDCMANETAALVVNTNSLLDALGPNPVDAPYVKAQIKTFIIPIDIPKSFTKAEVLKDVLAHMEGSVSDAKILEQIQLVKNNVLETGLGLQEPDVIQVCMPNILVDSREEESNSTTTATSEAVTQTSVAIVITTPLPLASEYTPSVPFSTMPPSGGAASVAVEFPPVSQPPPPSPPTIDTTTTTLSPPPPPLAPLMTTLLPSPAPTFAPPPPTTTLAPLLPPLPSTLPPLLPLLPTTTITTTHPPPLPPLAPLPSVTTLPPPPSLPPMTTLPALSPPLAPSIPFTTLPPPVSPPPMTTPPPLPPPPPPTLPPTPPPPPTTTTVTTLSPPPPTSPPMTTLPPPPSPPPIMTLPPPPPPHPITTLPPLPPTTFASPPPLTTLPPLSPPSPPLPTTTMTTLTFSPPPSPTITTLSPYHSQPSIAAVAASSSLGSASAPFYTTLPPQMTTVSHSVQTTATADITAPPAPPSSMGVIVEGSGFSETVEPIAEAHMPVSSQQASTSTPPVSSQTNSNIPALVTTSAVSHSNTQTEVHNTQDTTITQFTTPLSSPYSSVQAGASSQSEKPNYLPSAIYSQPTTVSIQPSSPSYSSDTSNIVLTVTTTGSPIAYLKEPSPTAHDMLSWPIILKPNLNKTCYDKMNLNYTIPIEIVNVTSLFEVLVGEVSPLDKYLTTTYLTSLDSYYKLYDFAIETYKYKNTFLHDVLNHLLSFHRNLETDKHIRRILERISFTNNAPLHSVVFCNQRIYDELPKPEAKYKQPRSEIFFTYETSTPCQTNGLVTYNIGTSLKNDMPPEVVQAFTEFLTYASRQNLFKSVIWEDIPTQRELVNLIVSTLEKQRVLNENQRQTVDYLYDHLKCDVLRFVRPTITKLCLVPHNLPPHFMKFVTEELCKTALFAPTNITYYVDVFSLLKTLTNVQPDWVETLVPLLSNSKLMQKTNLLHPFVVGSKGEFLREIIRRLAKVRDESLPISTLHDILKSVDVFGYGATPVETISDCPNLQTNHTSFRFIDRATALPCNITNLPATRMSRFIHIPTLLEAFHKNTSRKMLAPLRHILGHPNAYTILPTADNVNYTAAQFLQQVLNSLKAHSTPLMREVFNSLMTQLNMDYPQGFVVLERVCQNWMNTNGEYLTYPTAESCDYVNFDVDVSKVLENFHPNISQNQIIALGSHILTKNHDFYQLLNKVNPSEYSNYTDFLRAFIEASKTGPMTPASNLMSTLSNYIKDSQPLTVLTNCVEGPMDLASVITDDRLRHIIQTEDDLSFRSFDEPDTGLSDEHLKEMENMVLGERKLKENLYSLLGDQDNYIKQLQLLEKSDLIAENMYRNFDVIKVLPDDLETELLLRRYQTTVDDHEETTEAIQDVFDFLATKKVSRRKRETEPAKFSFDLLKIMTEYGNTPEDLLEKAKTISLNLETVTENTYYKDILPHIETLKPEEQILIVIRMVYTSVAPADSKILREIHNFYAPADELILDIEEHYNSVINLLDKYAKDQSVEDSKKLLTQNLKDERYEDRSIRKLLALSKSPKEFLTASLRRFRKILNKKLSPEALSVWMATSHLLKHLQVPVNDVSETGIDEDLDVIEFFGNLNGPTSVMKSKGAVLKHIIDNKKKLEDVFDGVDDMENFADEEKILIIMRRLLKRTEKDVEIGKVLEHVEALSEYITSLGYEIKERPLEGSYVEDLIQKVLDESSFNDTETVRIYFSKAMSDRPELFENVFRSLVIADYETPQQQLSEVLRQTYRMYSPKLGKDLIWAINSSFEIMNTSLAESSEDKFSGDFVDWVSTLIRQSLPDSMSQVLEEAYNAVVEVLEKQKLLLPKAMKGIRLFTHPKDLRARIVVLSLKGLEGLSEEETKAIHQIWEYLDVTEDEVLDETINQSRKASDVMTSVIADASEKLVKSQEVIISYLVPKGHQKHAYKGIRNTMKEIDVLVKLLDNIARSLNKFEQDLLVAGNSLLGFLEIPVLDSKTGEKNRLPKIISELENTFESTNDEMREALSNLITYIRTYPSTFEKIIASVPSDETVDNVVPNILKAVQNYETTISNRARTSALILDEFLKKDITLLSKKNKRSKANESEIDEAEVGKFEALKEASLRFLTSYYD